VVWAHLCGAEAGPPLYALCSYTPFTSIASGVCGAWWLCFRFRHPSATSGAGCHLQRYIGSTMCPSTLRQCVHSKSTCGGCAWHMLNHEPALPWLCWVGGLCNKWACSSGGHATQLVRMDPLTPLLVVCNAHPDGGIPLQGPADGSCMRMRMLCYWPASELGVSLSLSS
jgi:hypothetical protein